MDKARQLAAHKRLATGLFFLMLAVYVAAAWALRAQGAAWAGYVKAFAEAAMVGALADWFAVTALFHHPLGLPIPHTNLIERGKKAIGANLGAFVVSNFLTPAAIRPYIGRLALSRMGAEWLGADRNKARLVDELCRLLADILQKTDDALVARVIARKGRGLLADIRLNAAAASALEYFVHSGSHQELITLLAGKIRAFIGANEALVRERVKNESYFFIPSFVDNKLAAKISGGLENYFAEIEAGGDHRLRGEISQQLLLLAGRLRTEPRWEAQFQTLAQNLLTQEKVEAYAAAAWQSLKKTLHEELAAERSALKKYLSGTAGEMARSLRDDPAMQQKIDGWIRHTAYRYILRNRAGVGALITNTVGAWPGRELSRKLELEVGKDLQFIRINGTIVGGLVGLLIYAVTEWIG